MMYHAQDNFKFNMSNKTFDLTPIEEMTFFFQLLRQERMEDGALKEREHEK